MTKINYEVEKPKDLPIIEMNMHQLRKTAKFLYENSKVGWLTKDSVLMPKDEITIKDKFIIKITY
jgi:hypothetical protein